MAYRDHVCSQTGNRAPLHHSTIEIYYRWKRIGELHVDLTPLEAKRAIDWMRDSNYGYLPEMRAALEELAATA